MLFQDLGRMKGACMQDSVLQGVEASVPESSLALLNAVQ